MRRLEGRTALITGGTSGIGGGAALLFAREGARVIVLARGVERGRRFEADACAEGLDIKYYPCDVSVREEVCRVHERIRADGDTVDILVNNAGVLRSAALDEITDADWDAVYGTNLKSVVYMCQEFMPELKRAHGVVLNVASIDGLGSSINGRRNYLYATSKAALIRFTQHLAKNCAPEVRVNCLCPGFVPTDLFTNKDFSRFEGKNQLGRFIRADEVAKVALFLVSDDAAFITGSVVVADGGQSLRRL